jgi:hypothetical protein
MNDQTDVNETKDAEGQSLLNDELGVTTAGYYWWRETKEHRWIIADVWQTNWGYVAHMHDGCRADFIHKKAGEFSGPIPTPNV